MDITTVKIDLRNRICIRFICFMEVLMVDYSVAAEITFNFQKLTSFPVFKKNKIVKSTQI